MTEKQISLPELPEPAVMCDCGGDYFTADQLRAYVAEAVGVARQPLVDLLQQAMDAIPDYEDGRNDDLCDEIAQLLERLSQEDHT